MITEDFCSFEVAQLLKKKGFDELCIFKYNSEGVRMKAGVAIDEWQNSELDDDECSCVSHQMAMKWLREVHGLIISIEYQIICPTWKWRIYIKSSDDKHTDFQHYNKYEEAVESALKYCLENLI